MDILSYLLGKKAGGGGSSVTVEALTVTENKIYTAPSGKAFSPITASVPNTYTAEDEGKVVDNGQLVTQPSAQGVDF